MELPIVLQIALDDSEQVIGFHARWTGTTLRAPWPWPPEAMLLYQCFNLLENRVRNL